MATESPQDAEHRCHGYGQPLAAVSPLLRWFRCLLANTVHPMIKLAIMIALSSDYDVPALLMSWAVDFMERVFYLQC